ncbi:MAG: patatin-like phospholipase family protein [Pseudomonadota bacterium]|nr:patatin-like phospholipase family protein [Pseudomonadota bacterium]
MLRIYIMSIILLFITGCAGPVHMNIPANEPKPLKLSKRPHVALVLGGGAARGYAHVGILKVFQREHIPMDLIVGASAGSLVGALYADNANAAYVERTMRNTKFFSFADFTILSSGYGFISGRQLQRFLLDHMRSRWFDELKIPLVVVATDLNSGNVKVLSSGPIPPAVNASSAMPGAVHPVNLYGCMLVDGGMVAQLPVNIAKRYHPDIIIAVTLQPDLEDELPTSILGVFRRSFDISLRTVETFSGEGADLTIHPRVGKMGMFDIDKKAQLIHLGEIAAEQAMPKIKALLKKKAVCR